MDTSSSGKKRKNLYSQDQLYSALAELKNGSLNFSGAASKYGIPKSTLFDKINGKYSLEKSKPGPKSAMTLDKEERLRSWLVSMIKIGYQVSKPEIKYMAQDILNENKRKNGILIPFEEQHFSSNRSGLCWVYRFLNRCPEINEKIQENLGQKITEITEEYVRFWFYGLREYLCIEHGLDVDEFLQGSNGNRVFNLDQCGFPLNAHGRLLEITTKTLKITSRIAPDNKEQITVLTCAAASGKYCKPFVVLPGINPIYNFDYINKNDFDIGKTLSGWMTPDCFFSWLVDIFYPTIKDLVEFPILIFIDGHSAHLNVTITEFCRKHQIILYCLPHHVSHIMHPLNISIYSALKQLWNTTLDDFENYKNLVLNKSNFFAVFDQAWRDIANDPNVIAYGFRKSGLFPFNPNAIQFPILEKPQTVKKNHRKRKNSNDLPYFEKLIPSSYEDQTNCVDADKPSEETSHEKFGMIRALKVFESVLTEAQLLEFNQRYVEGLEVVGTTEEDILWRYYKKMKLMIEEHT